MKEYIAEYIVPVEKKGNDQMFDFMNAKRLIRCKDCRWFVRKECSFFCLSSAHEETFCSYAEPKETS